MRRTLMMAVVMLLTLTTVTSPALAEPTPQIPDRVLLQPQDLHGAEPEPVEADLAYSLLPQPCVDSPVPRPLASRSLAANYSDRYRIYQNVALYPPGGARGYLDVLKEQLDRCGVGGGEAGYDPVAVDHIGPDTALFLKTHDEGDRWVAYVAAAVDDYVIVTLVADRTPLQAGDPTLANELTLTTLRRAAEGGCTR